MMNFYNFPHDFDSKNNFFRSLFMGKEFENYDVDLIDFYGCYPKVSTIKKASIYLASRFSDKGMNTWLKHQQGLPPKVNAGRFNIWCTFENRRPPNELMDLTLSFDQDTYKGKNFYLPLIFLYIDLLDNGKEYVRHKFLPQALLKSREISIGNKEHFAVSFINNPEQTRLRAIEALRNIGPVDIFGRSVNNYVKDKIKTASPYWFSVCFENDLYPGYVTEKALESWIAGTIPLYWGLDEGKILNPKAIVNLNDFETLERFVEFVEELFADKGRMKSMIEEPILNRDFNLIGLINFFKNSIPLKSVQ